MNRRWVMGIVLVIAVMIIGGGISLATTSPAEVRAALHSLCPTKAQEIMSALEIGFSQGRLPPEEALRLINRLIAVEGDTAEKQEILVTIAHALEDDLPVSLLVEKVEEGLARRISLALILHGSGRQPRILGLIQREFLLSTVRDLLYARRIFSVPEGTKAASPSLPIARFDNLVNQISDFLADYIEGGGSPLEGALMKQELGRRLHNLATLQKPVIPEEDVKVTLDRIDPNDLTNIVLKVFEQP